LVLEEVLPELANASAAPDVSSMPPKRGDHQR